MKTLESTQRISAYEITGFSENKALRRVTATVQTNLGPRTLLLWGGDAYDAAGQYTDEDIDARVVALLSQ